MDVITGRTEDTRAWAISEGYDEHTADIIALWADEIATVYDDAGEVDLAYMLGDDDALTDMLYDTDRDADAEDETLCEAVLVACRRLTYADREGNKVSYKG